MASKCVWFATNNDAPSGFNGFPFKVPVYEEDDPILVGQEEPTKIVGILEKYDPVPITLKHAVELVWRVRRFKLSSYTASVSAKGTVNDNIYTRVPSDAPHGDPPNSYVQTWGVGHNSVSFSQDGTDDQLWKFPNNKWENGVNVDPKPTGEQEWLWLDPEKTKKRDIDERDIISTGNPTTWRRAPGDGSAGAFGNDVTGYSGEEGTFGWQGPYDGPWEDTSGMSLSGGGGVSVPTSPTPREQDCSGGVWVTEYGCNTSGGLYLSFFRKKEDPEQLYVYCIQMPFSLYSVSENAFIYYALQTDVNATISLLKNTAGGGTNSNVWGIGMCNDPYDESENPAQLPCITSAVADLDLGPVGSLNITSREGTVSFPIYGNIATNCIGSYYSEPALYYGNGTGLVTAEGSMSANVNVQAAEYWPYATKLGDPVWATTTGAQIKDPTS